MSTGEPALQSNYRVTPLAEESWLVWGPLGILRKTVGPCLKGPWPIWSKGPAGPYPSCTAQRCLCGSKGIDLNEPADI